MANLNPIYKWQPGKSGNPSGRPKDILTPLARQHTKLALDRLVFWVKSKNSAASVKAAEILLDRGWGKPIQFMTGDGNGNAVIIKIINFSEIKAVAEKNEIEHNGNNAAVQVPA